jgi:histidine triad (HIT) family protein
MENCLFCRIVNKKIPAKVVAEDDKILAFEDVNPQAPVHVLLIPKDHYASLNEIPEDKRGILADVLLKAREIARAKGIDQKGYRVVLNTARDSGQAVFHIHFHLLGGRIMSWPPG